MQLLTVLIVAVLVTLSALFSGLTLGLLSLNPHTLRRKKRLGDKNAERIYPIRKRGNLLLATLLLGNVAVNSTLAVFLGSIATGFVAGLVATGLIVIFGEIVPQAVISRHALRFGAKTAWLVEIFMFLLFPVTKPIAYALDKLLGAELPTMYNKRELALLLEEQAGHDLSDVDEDEADMAVQTLELSHKRVRDHMVPIQQAYRVDAKEPLTARFLEEVEEMGHSRIPVMSHTGKSVVGILFAKDLISVPPDTYLVEDVMRRSVTRVGYLQHLDTILELFREKKQHLFIVRKGRETVGIITLEDVIEEITGEIHDEYD